MRDLCEFSYGFDTVKWLHVAFGLPEDIMATTLSEDDQQSSFSFACKAGNLPAAKWLLDKFGSVPDPFHAFCVACENK
jgi:hypothetical protein